jgi:hypothetical protein
VQIGNGKNDDFKRLGENGFNEGYINLKDGVERILKQKTFKFTDLHEFDDPFDCNERLIDIVISPEEEKKLIRKVGKKHNIPRKVIRQHYPKIGKNTHYQQALKFRRMNSR